MIDNLMNAQDNFEVIRDQIATILATEIANQKILAVDAGEDPANYDARVYVERTRAFEQFLNVPVTDTTPLINVTYESSNFDKSASSTVSRQKTSGIYNIDCYGYGSAEADGSTGQKPGDMQSAFAVQQAIRIVRNILMASTYAVLDMQKVVWARWIDSINVFQPIIDNNPLQNVLGARVSFNVTFNETAPQATPVTLEGVGVDVHRTVDGQIIVQAEYDYT